MAFNSSSAVDRRDAVRGAIDKVLNSQDYSIGGRRVRYADLSALDRLEQRTSREAEWEGGNPFSVIQIDRPT